MVVHSMQVCFDGRVFDVWKIDDDTTNIMEFYGAIKEDLVDEDDTFRFDITAYIRGGEHVVNVDSDSSMMQMFNLNTNPIDVILLDVKSEKCVPSTVMPANTAVGHGGFAEHVGVNEKVFGSTENDNDDSVGG